MEMAVNLKGNILQVQLALTLNQKKSWLPLQI